LLLKIEKLVYGGDGLARLTADDNGPGKAIFVPFVLEGEEVEAAVIEEKRGFARGRAEKVLVPSSKRAEPKCPYFGFCGGCHYQHISYEHQLEIKAAILKENLRRIAKLELTTELIVHNSPPWNYRNRTRLQVQTSPEFAVGFYKLNSHEFLPVEECPISSPTINRAIAATWEVGKRGSIAPGIEEIEFFANAQDSQLLAELYCSSELAEPGMRAASELRAAIPELAGAVIFMVAPKGSPDAKEIGRVGAGELLWKTSHNSYRVSAGAFFQVNRYLTDKLLQIVTDEPPGQTALDLYAGSGLFSTVLSKQFAQVIAVESSPISHSDLRYNSPPNVRVVRAMTDQFLKQKTVRADLVVVDPPRSGLGESVVRELVGMAPRHMTYVSCDPATLSRDVYALLQGGYRVEQAHFIDLFPQTFHLESVLKLVR
jgi:23S rRNA (uracil1939-C5)-methyltransferase